MMKTNAVAALAGALVTLILLAIAFVILNGVCHGNFPWLLSALTALLCPLIGGFVVTRLKPANRARLGELSGFGAGLVVILAIAIASSLALNATLLGILVLFVGTFGGGDWVHIETPEGSVRARARMNDTLQPEVVCGQHGWWQASPGIGAPAYGPLSPDASNLNLLIGNATNDPVCGSVPHRAYLCQIRREEKEF